MLGIWARGKASACLPGSRAAQAKRSALTGCRLPASRALRIPCVLRACRSCLAFAVSETRVEHVRLLLQHFPAAAAAASSPMSLTALHVAALLPALQTET